MAQIVYPDVLQTGGFPNAAPRLLQVSQIRAYEKGKDLSARPSVTEEGKKILFGQTARSVKA